MQLEDNYDKFNKEDVNKLNELNFNFNLNDRFIHVTDKEGKYFKCHTPFLKVLKPVHVTLNKKKQVANKYLILETNDDLDFNNQISEFMFIINKIHEISQEKIKQNSIEWFNTEFDEIGLDIKVKRPIDQQKNSEFIRLTISKDKYIEEEINKLEKDMYVLCNIIFKGLRVSNDYIVEDWELVDIMTQEKFDEIQNSELLCESINNTEIMNTLLTENNEEEHKELVKEEEFKELVKELVKEEEFKELVKEEEFKELVKEEEFKELVKEEEQHKKHKEKKVIKGKNILVKRINKKIIFT